MFSAGKKPLSGNEAKRILSEYNLPFSEWLQENTKYRKLIITYKDKNLIIFSTKNGKYDYDKIIDIINKR